MPSPCAEPDPIRQPGLGRACKTSVPKRAARSVAEFALKRRLRDALTGRAHGVVACRERAYRRCGVPLWRDRTLKAATRDSGAVLAVVGDCDPSPS